VDKTSKNVVEALADNVKRRMAESGLSGPTIYAKTGVSVGTLSRITNEGVATGIDNVERLAEIFGCEPWELLVPDDETREAIIAVRAIQRRPKD
jgi:transcriptional regulator with XRE-family HTH domain